jgi:hypothetical protein
MSLHSLLSVTIGVPWFSPHMSRPPLTAQICPVM